MNGIRALIKETLECSLIPSTMWRHSKRTCIYKPWSRSALDTKSAGTFILHFPGSSLQEIYFCCLEAIQYGVLLEQPKWIKTPTFALENSDHLNSTRCFTPPKKFPDIQHIKELSLSDFSCTVSLFFFFLFVCTHGIWKVLGQGLKPRHSSNVGCSSNDVGSLTRGATRELLQNSLLIT